MADDLIYQHWAVPKLGYGMIEVVDLEDRDRPYEWGLSEVVDEDAERLVRMTHPLRNTPALFRTFADLAGQTDRDANFKAVIEFANQYGWLGVVEPPLSRWVIAGGDGRKYSGQVERIYHWAMQVHSMREAVDLIDAIKDKDLETLGQWLRWDGPAVLYRREFPGGSSSRWLNPEFDEWLRGVLTPNDDLGAARLVAQQIINGSLGPHTATRLLFERSDQNQLRLHVVPKNLLGAMWIQAAQAIEGGRQFLRCEHCRTWYAVGPNLTRSDRTYCSDNCRFKAYRKRQEEARSLHAKGLTPSAIAKRLKSTTPTVRGWLGLEASRKRSSA